MVLRTVTLSYGNGVLRTAYGNGVLRTATLPYGTRR